MSLWDAFQRKRPMKHKLSFEAIPTSITHTHTHTEVGVKPFKVNEGLMIDWEWLLQLVIVIVKPLAVSLYSHHKITDRDRCGLGEVQQN